MSGLFGTGPDSSRQASAPSSLMTPGTSKESRGHHPTGGPSASSVCGVSRPQEQSRRGEVEGCVGGCSQGEARARCFQGPTPQTWLLRSTQALRLPGSRCKATAPCSAQSTKAGTGPPPGAGWSPARQHRGAWRPTFLGSSGGPSRASPWALGARAKCPTGPTRDRRSLAGRCVASLLRLGAKPPPA